MFLIRCSILNYVNADIEESQYYIIPGFKKNLPYYLIAFQRRKTKRKINLKRETRGNIVKDNVWL